LAQVDVWFSGCMASLPNQIVCGRGCSGCCRGLFDITLLDGALLAEGFAQLSETVRNDVLAKAAERLAGLEKLWPELAPPFTLNHRPEADWERLMPDDDETPCPLLANDGSCLVYTHRPLTCRLHGLPHVDLSGAIMHDEWCTENFATTDPLIIPALRGDFRSIFTEEVQLGRQFTRHLLGEEVRELDTLIPLALLVDIQGFPWRYWWTGYRQLLPPGALPLPR
ncbi:MAG TPA: YkgJ family cysteine cluster protein, partial [Geobacteraceae bacterium]